MSGLNMDPFSNAIFPFTLAASLTMITGFFHASGFELEDDRDCVLLSRMGITVPVMTLLTIAFGFFAAVGFTVTQFANDLLTTPQICALAFLGSILMTASTVRAVVKAMPRSLRHEAKAEG
jgi:hypothetical protein